MQRRHAMIRILFVNVCLRIRVQQELDNVCVPVESGNMERRVAIRC